MSYFNILTLFQTQLLTNYWTVLASTARLCTDWTDALYGAGRVYVLVRLRQGILDHVQGSFMERGVRGVYRREDMPAGGVGTPDRLDL